MTKSVDILMITFNSPDYVRLSLPRLLDSCDDHMRVWVWHNGTDEATLEAARSFSTDDRVHRFHHSIENVRLTEPTNWLWSNSDADFVSKVDDDCLLDLDWAQRLREAHASNPAFGAIGAARLLDEDIVPELVEAKLQTFQGGVQLLRNHWVQGSGYLAKRAFIEQGGPVSTKRTWTSYCLDLARKGWVNGFLYPFIFEDHMDDPRSEHTLLKSDADFEWRMPLSSKRSDSRTLEDWEQHVRSSAYGIQKAPIDMKYWTGWRRWKRAALARSRALLDRAKSQTHVRMRGTP